MKQIVQWTRMLIWTRLLKWTRLKWSRLATIKLIEISYQMATVKFFSSINGFITELFLAFEELVQLCQPFRASWSSCFELACPQANSQISDENIFCFIWSVWGHYTSFGIECRSGCFKRFGKCTYLIDFQQKRICSLFFNGLFYSASVSDSKIVSHDGDTASNFGKKMNPGVPVILRK